MMSDTVFITTIVSLSVFMLSTVLSLVLLLSTRIDRLSDRIDKLDDRLRHVEEDVLLLKAAS
jgi:hypothetical protein